MCVRVYDCNAIPKITLTDGLKQFTLIFAYSCLHFGTVLIQVCFLKHKSLSPFVCVMWYICCIFWQARVINIFANIILTIPAIVQTCGVQISLILYHVLLYFLLCFTEVVYIIKIIILRYKKTFITSYENVYLKKKCILLVMHA